MYLLYSALLAAAMVLATPFWLWQMLRHGKYRRGFRERWGRVPARILKAGVWGGHSCPPTAGSIEIAGAIPGAGKADKSVRPTCTGSIWVHAVSVGEVLAVAGLVAELRKRFPSHRVVVSTTTDTGQKLARDRFGTDSVFYFPLDFAFAIRPYLESLKPELVVLAETEFWPNFLRLAKSNRAKIAVVNARISDRSLPGYQRFRRLLARVLAQVDVFLTQTVEDQRRLADIGAPPERIQVSGNLKFDAPEPKPAAIVAQLRDALAKANAGPVLICGSTVEGEEPILLSAFQSLLTKHPHAVMVLAPRHPERFGEVTEDIQRSGLPFQRRSQWDGTALPGGVFLLDSIGELAAMYSLSDLAFVGGSLVPRGGHNILEPARYGVAIVVGPHTENFRDVIELFRVQNAVRVSGAAHIGADLLELMSDEATRNALSRRASEVLQAQAGATQRTLNALTKFTHWHG